MFKHTLEPVIGRSFFCLITLLFVYSAHGQITYTTIADGNWNSAATWDAAGVPPTGSDIPSTTTINIQHTVTYNTGDPINNRGVIRIEPLTNTTASLVVPTGINVNNHSTGSIYILRASYIQCRFTTCNNGEPYNGNNPGAPIQSGTFKNIGGYNEARGSVIEIAQDWTSESGGTRLIIDSCIKTGQNFSLSDSGTTDTITRSLVSAGWHASGNVELADGTANYQQFRVQIAGASGSFKLNSGTANGDIQSVQLMNQIAPFTGTGEVFASSSLSTSGLALGFYCVSAPNKYIPNGKFSGPQTELCDPADLSCFAPLAANVSVEGRVRTGNGRGISNAVVEITGGGLLQPISVVTGSFGYYRFDDIPAGETYIVTVRAKRYSFSNPSQIVQLVDNLTGLDFVADDGGYRIIQKDRR